MFSSILLIVSLVSTSHAASPEVCQKIVKLHTCAMVDGSDSDCVSGGTADYAGIAAAAKATFDQMQTQCEGGGHMLAGGSSDVTPYDSVDPAHNGGLASARLGYMFNALIGGNITTASDDLMLRTEARWVQRGADKGAKFGAVWVVSDEMLRSVPGQDLFAKKLEGELRMKAYYARNSPDNSTFWGLYALRLAATDCQDKLVITTDGMPQYIPKADCACRKNTETSDEDLLDFATTTPAGLSVDLDEGHRDTAVPPPVPGANPKPPLPPTTQKSSAYMAADLTYERMRWAKVASCPNVTTGKGDEKFVWDPVSGDCRAPVTTEEVIAGLLGEKLPRFDTPVFNRVMTYFVGHGFLVSGDLGKDGMITIQRIDDPCAKQHENDWMIEEADRLARYQGFSGTAAVVAAPGYAYPPEGNPYHLEAGGIGDGEFHAGLRYGWLNYRTERKATYTGATTTKVTNINANAMSVDLDLLVGAGYHPVSCPMPASVKLGGELIVSGGRSNHVGWSGGFGYARSYSLWGGQWVYSHHAGFVDFTVDIHPGGSVGMTTFEIGIRQAANMVTSDPTASALDLSWTASQEGYTTLVPVTSAVIGLRW